MGSWVCGLILHSGCSENIESLKDDINDFC